ncbi:CASP-like protein 1F1 [Nymphaea thermarum]|nr:CASP-like protein 1F1 [Nymphaea thermarum]
MAVESVEVAKTIKPEEYPMCRNFLILQVLLRLLAGAAALVAAITMAVNKTTFVYFGLSITAKFNYSGAYEFFVGANSIAFAYAAVSAVFLKLKSPSPKPKSQFLIFFLDLTMVALLIAGCSAALAVGYIAKYGNPHAGWIPVCRYMESFCNIGVIAIVFSFGAFLVFYLLAAITMKSPRQIPVASC